jgi:hypothetical protein
MTRSVTPILDLETAPPTPRLGVSAKGLLKTLPVAIGMVALIPAAIYLQFVLGAQLPPWLSAVFPPVSRALDTAFQRGPVVAIILIYLAMFLVTVVHEAGHALAAILIGWPILEFRVVPFSMQKQTGKWKLHFNWRVSPPGLVMAHPAAIRFHSKVRIYALAGPVANLATGILLGAVQIGAEGSILTVVPILFAGWSVFIGILNLLPIRIQGLELDGYVALVVSRKPKPLAARVASMRMREHIHGDKPLDSMNQRWVALAEGTGPATLQSKGGMWFAYSYWLEREEFERAALVLEKLLGQSQNVDQKFRALLFTEGAVISALRGKRSSANLWKERSATLSVPELIHHRCNSYVAWVNQDMDRARLEAELAADAAAKLKDKAARERFLRSWSRWLGKLQETRSAFPGSL